MKNLPLRWRLLIPVTLLILIAAVVLSATIPKNVYTQQLELVQQRMIAKLHLLDDLLAGDWSSLAEVVSTSNDFQDDAIAVLTPNGQVLYQSEPDEEIILASSELQQALNGRGSGFAIRRNDEGETYAYAAIISEQEDGSPVLVHLSHSFQDSANLRLQIYRIIWLTAGGIWLFSATAFFLISNRAERRLKTLTEKTNTLRAGGYGEPIPVSSRDELSLLEHTLNRQAAALDMKIRRIQAEQNQLNAILDQMTDGVMIVSGDGSITLVNPATKKIFGLEGMSVLGQRLPRVLGYHQILEMWQDFQADRQEQAAFLELADRKQSIYVILIPFEDFLPDHALLLFQDLTRLRQLETVRRDFLSNVSHELRTPLASLKALAETLQISALDDPEATRKFLARMDTEIDALTQLVSELLELSRIESGQVPLQFSPVSPAALLAGAFERLKVQADRAEVEYILSAPKTETTVLADANRIEQTLVNLIHNAIKYTDPGGSVSCAYEITADEVIFSIQDTGMGISGQDLPRIFERFYKVRGSRKASGTGLGLAIAKHLVELHHGRIWAESELGVGSSFFIALPRQS